MDGCTGSSTPTSNLSVFFFFWLILYSRYLHHLCCCCGIDCVLLKPTAAVDKLPESNKDLSNFLMKYTEICNPYAVNYEYRPSGGGKTSTNIGQNGLDVVKLVHSSSSSFGRNGSSRTSGSGQTNTVSENGATLEYPSHTVTVVSDKGNSVGDSGDNSFGGTGNTSATTNTSYKS